MNPSNPLVALHRYGQSFWWDTLSRRLLDDGTLARLRDTDGMRGVTSNPSIFQSAIAGSQDYDEAIAARAAAGLDPVGIFWELAIEDIQRSCDVLRPVYDAAEGGDGFVSLEVDPHLAHDGEGTLIAAKELWARVDRPNLMIKIPATAAGMPAIRAALVDGINVNVTLLFAIEAHRQVMEIYQEALRERQERGLPIDRVASVASFFISRVDSLVDARLAKLEDPHAATLRGKAAIANAKLAYQAFLELFAREEWATLARAGARVQRPLWASTSTKDPSYSDVLYVDELVGEDTVNTIPTVTVDAYRDHGRPAAARVLEGVDAARDALGALEELGISMDEVTAHLLEDGVGKFQKSFDDLLAAVREKTGTLSG